MKPPVKTHFTLAKGLLLPLALLVFAILLSNSEGRRIENLQEYPHGYTTRVLVDKATGIYNMGYTWEPTASADGRWVAFSAPIHYPKGNILIYGHSLFVYDRQTGEAVCASVTKDGTPSEGQSPDISADGQFVAFTSMSRNLPGIDNSPYNDIYVYDRITKRTVLVSMAFNEQATNGSSSKPSISADGRYVAFVSEASNMVQDDTNQVADIFVADLKSGEIKRVSSAPDGTEANGPSYIGRISASGRYVAFVSKASDLPAGSAEGMYVFLHDMETGKTVSISADQGLFVSSFELAISADGRYIVYYGWGRTSTANNREDSGLYLYDRQSGRTEFLVKGLNGEHPDSPVFGGTISDNGRYVAFASAASNLVAGESNRQANIYVLDRETGTIQRVSVSSENAPADGPCGNPAISADGQHVVFVSEAQNLVEGYPSGALGVYIHDLSNWGDYPHIDARRFSQAEPFPGPYPPPTSVVPSSPYPAPYP